VGFKMHWRLPPTQRQRLAGVIELTLFSGGYAGVQMVGEDVANLCLALRRDRLAELGGRWEDVLAMLSARSPDLRRLVDAEPLFARPVTIANLSYGRLHGVGGPDHAYRLGDQAAMTASLTGDGMAIALRSAWLAAHCLLEGEGPAVYHARLRAMVGTQMRRGMFIQRLAERRAPRPFAMGAMRLWPGVLRAMVGLTRLPMLSQI
jgi:flavin-dependent dehydrogenase